MKKIFLVLVAFFFFGSFMLGTTLQMRDGRLIDGKYLGGTAESVNLLVNGKVQTYPVSKILLIDFGTASPTVSSTPATPSAPVEHAALAPTGKIAAKTESVMVPAGTQIQVRMIDTIDSQIDKVGDKFQASLDQPIEVNGQLVVAKDSTLYGRLVQSTQAGTLAGRSELRLELTGINIAGQVVPIVTSDYDVAGKSRGRQTAERTGIGAGIGAIIGAIAGGGKGAGIGAAVGGGAGAASQVITHGQDVHIPSETLLDFTLAQPFTAHVLPGSGQ